MRAGVALYMTQLTRCTSSSRRTYQSRGGDAFRGPKRYTGPPQEAQFEYVGASIEACGTFYMMKEDG
jgi:hypothetical protein